MRTIAELLAENVRLLEHVAVLDDIGADIRNAWAFAWDAEWRAQQEKMLRNIYRERVMYHEMGAPKVGGKILALEAALAEAMRLVRELLPYMERHSYSWDGVNGEHPQGIKDDVDAFIAAHGEDK